jgi:hypothetical protein
MYIRNALRMGRGEESSEPAETQRDSFELAALAFEDQRCLIGADRIDSKTEEQRWHAIGAAQIERGAPAVLLVVHVLPGGLSWQRNYPHHLGPRG